MRHLWDKLLTLIRPASRNFAVDQVVPKLSWPIGGSHEFRRLIAALEQLNAASNPLKRFALYSSLFGIPDAADL